MAMRLAEMIDPGVLQHLRNGTEIPHIDNIP